MAGRNKCQSCNGNATLKDSLQCKLCSSVTMHWKCSGVTEPTTKELLQAVNFVWICKNCLEHIDMFRSNKQLSELTEEIRKLQESNVSLSNQVKIVQNKLDSRDDNESIDDRIVVLQENLKKSYADTLKDVVTTNVVKLNDEVINDCFQALKKEMIETKEAVSVEFKNVQKTLVEASEAKKKERNIMLFRLSEHGDDKKRIIQIFKHLTDDAVNDKDVIKILRLGKKKENSNRPLLIKMDNIKIKALIMSNLSRLKLLNNEFGNISLSHDLTKDQRIELKSLVDEARKQEAASGDFLFRVRGPPGRWKIMKLPMEFLYELLKDDVSSDVFILGDFNIDLAVKNQASLSFLNLMAQFNLHPIINQPTRITSSHSSTIDNVFTNYGIGGCPKGILYSDVSDHLPIFLCIPLNAKAVGGKNPYIKTRLINSENLKKANCLLQNIQWNMSDYGSDFESNFKNFLKTYLNCINLALPLVNKKNGFRRPWMNIDLYNLSLYKNVLYKRHLHNPSPENKNAYNKITSATRQHGMLMSKKVRTSTYDRSWVAKGVRLWNALAMHNQLQLTIEHFKHYAKSEVMSMSVDV
ncbi:hypothetical protein HELRODRAFT_181060 [Helobdella robusta]|uniref:Zinc finger PHD-type domain-containing protein n=1 Tax=Helobdella robusta TaxID=6412 RepID=T1FGK4_HELRO|nr:hypothetical protein HELRODRAFT_181060 [Helobdella robusta]ESN93310.1 hypothetical protein HELRODRAFT_181060 [Helobdella robusta]